MLGSNRNRVKWIVLNLFSLCLFAADARAITYFWWPFTNATNIMRCRVRNRIDCIAAEASGLARDQFAQESRAPKAMATTRNRAIVSLRNHICRYFVRICCIFSHNRRLLRVRRHRVVLNFRTKNRNKTKKIEKSSHTAEARRDGCRQENSSRVVFTHRALALHYTSIC